MEKEITAITLDNPSLNLPDTSYGFSNEPLSDSQVKIGSNRDIYNSLHLMCFDLPEQVVLHTMIFFLGICERIKNELKQWLHLYYDLDSVILHIQQV